MATGTLARYNFRVMMFSNWWLLVFPLAASQLTVFWTLITQRFVPDIPAFTVEMVSPLLAAFLCAHTLGAEYRSNMGVILASKPMHIGKVVLQRLAVSLGLVWALAALSLAAYYFGFEPYDVVRPALACVVSTLFLGMFALTFATLFRHSLAGFGAAALYWALDLPPGPTIHPYLSLRSLTSSFALSGMPEHLPFTDDWWAAKLILLGGAVLLYALHARAVFTLGSPMTARRSIRSIAWLAGVLVVYLASGAATKVVYGYTHRGALWPDDAVWFRRQFASYGPIPAASLFGPAFTRYLGPIPNGWRVMGEGDSDTYGDSREHVTGLREVVDRMPRSVWAAGAASLYGRLEARRQTEADKKAALFRLVTDRYPKSPYAAAGLRESARAYVDSEEPARAAALYRELQQKYPGNRWRAEALGFLTEYERSVNNLPAAVQLARQWIASVPPGERFPACIDLAECLMLQGDRAGATDAARRALDDAREFRARFLRPGSAKSPRTVRMEAAATDVEHRASAILSGAR